MTVTAINTPLRPLNPTLHSAYTEALFHSSARVPSAVLAGARALVERRNTAPEDEIERLDARIVEALWWYVLRPDEIARSTLRHHGWSGRRPLSIDQATVVLAAIGEAGYPIVGNGAPDFDMAPPPTCGAERDRVLWAAAKHWATVAASRSHTYVSLGDARGYLPRPVQYDQPGSMDPTQRAALTLGPLVDRSRETRPHDYMRRHTRLLLLVRGAADA